MHPRAVRANSSIDTRTRSIFELQIRWFSLFAASSASTSARPRSGAAPAACNELARALREPKRRAMPGAEERRLSAAPDRDRVRHTAACNELAHVPHHASRKAERSGAVRALEDEQF